MSEISCVYVYAYAFLESFSANNFALSDEEDNTSGLLNRRGIAGLALLKILLAICQKLREQVSGKWWILLFY